MGLDLDYYVDEGPGMDDFNALGYAVKRLTDDVLPDLLEIIPEDRKRLLMDLRALTTILNVQCGIIEEQFRRSEAKATNN